ncbi:phytanoyl-CoA dioxygenase family protein [Mycolicibacterium goodii]|uniref:phytanoyl-CoA dioxygenase family protein n=1 Tax=Mycolicibacterium goodii TaxID=134601 RepID=UPI000C25BE13|nr:phytanoyl-CoA dioxygenase family protein [Mycolicibacterium goodii]PJK18220.1 hypothetical protein CSX11_32395 [Mycolicibacterium goodii]
MVSIDYRTRFADPTSPITLDGFVAEYASVALRTRGESTGRAALDLGLPALTFVVEGARLSLTPRGNGLDVTHGDSGELEAVMDTATFSALVTDRLSTYGAHFTQRACVTSGRLDDFLAWEPVLRHLLDDRPIYRPGSLDFVDRHKAPLDLHRGFSLDDDDPRDIGHFLAEAGFLHITGLFTADEMAAMAADLDACVATAQRDDGTSWWARTEPGGWYAARILGFNHRSSALRHALTSVRFAALATFTEDEFVQEDPYGDIDMAEGLLKRIGVVEGPSDVGWHKDCTMGGHSYSCGGLVVGISLTDAGPETGELVVAAGSNRVNVAPSGIKGVDLPQIPLATEAGDVTVHCSCTLHMSRPPRSAERRVVYTGFALAPAPGTLTPDSDAGERRRARAGLNDLVLASQRKAQL